MELADLSKDIRRLLLAHWTEPELQSSLQDPDYFFDQVVNPRLDYLRRQGEYAPRLRVQRTPAGETRVLLLP
jgi:hypothetical protein